jgi:hypothetical protein
LDGERRRDCDSRRGGAFLVSASFFKKECMSQEETEKLMAELKAWVDAGMSGDFLRVRK